MGRANKKSWGGRREESVKPTNARRRRDVIRLRAAGLGQRAVAAKLGISRRTVSYYLALVKNI